MADAAFPDPADFKKKRCSSAEDVKKSGLAKALTNQNLKVQRKFSNYVNELSAAKKVAKSQIEWKQRQFVISKIFRSDTRFDKLESVVFQGLTSNLGEKASREKQKSAGLRQLPGTKEKLMKKLSLPTNLLQYHRERSTVLSCPELHGMRRSTDSIIWPNSPTEDNRRKSTCTSLPPTSNTTANTQPNRPTTTTIALDPNYSVPKQTYGLKEIDKKESPSNINALLTKVQDTNVLDMTNIDSDRCLVKSSSDSIYVPLKPSKAMVKEINEWLGQEPKLHKQHMKQIGAQQNRFFNKGLIKTQNEIHLKCQNKADQPSKSETGEILSRITNSLPVSLMAKSEKQRKKISAIMGYEERNQKLLTQEKTIGRMEVSCDQRFVSLLEELSPVISRRTYFKQSGLWVKQ